MKPVKLIWALIFVFTAFSCSTSQEGIRYQKWYVSQKVLEAGLAGSLDNVAVKDPSIIYFKGQYHLFYTAKSKILSGNDVKYSTGSGYVHANSIEELKNARRYSLDSIAGCPVIAPQIFFFEPHHCWYLIGHTADERDNLSKLKPVYLKNPNIEDVNGWSRAEEIVTGKTDTEFWIDFWVICDEDHAYLFYSNQKGSVLRLECDLGDFPEGFAQSKPEIALHVDHRDDSEPWRMFEAVHIYHVQKEQKYLAVLEGARPHPAREGDVDSRNRFMFGMIADSLNGSWKRIEQNENQFLAEGKNLMSRAGNHIDYTQVSHPELLRSGYDQRLEIPDYNLTMIFQTFDGSVIPDSYEYNALPWELVLMKNHLQDRDAGYTTPPKIQYEKWTVSQPVLEAGPKGTFDEIAVKDPSIVYYNHKYHMFYTSKATYETRDRVQHLSKNGSGFGYVSAPSLDKMHEAIRYDLGRIIGSVIVAPQVFYFEPQKLWYIIAQTIVEGQPDLMPIYLTNPDIEDVNGWSEPEIINTGKSNNGFWIDFWVICDEQKAHLFYTDHEGSLFRFECPLDEFPHGYEGQKEETVLTVRGENNTGRWRLHEASHIYYVKDHDCYLNLLEAVYPHPERKNYWDSRNRFMFAMTAEKLEGPWTRVELGMNQFLGDPGNLYNEAGDRSIYDQVSHPELIRSGYDQNLEIEDYHLQMIFQAFDADTTGAGYDYNYLPWKLLLMKNYQNNEYNQ